MARNAKFVQWNCRSLLPKRSQLIDILHSEPIVAMAIQETWLQEENRFTMPGYQVFRKDRSPNANEDRPGRGGGIVTLVHDSIPAEPGPNLPWDANDETESNHVVLHLPNETLHVYNIYHPPGRGKLNTAAFQQLEHPCLVMGDLNAHSPLWKSNLPTNSNGKELENLVSDA